MAKKTGKDLQPIIRYLILEDGSLREMRMTYRAKAELEEFFSPHVKRMACELGRMPTEEELKSLDTGMGNLKQVAHMAWILTSTWRRRNEPTLEFEDFLDLFPGEDDKIAQISASIEVVTGTGSGQATEESPEGNEPEAAQ